VVVAACGGGSLLPRTGNYPLPDQPPSSHQYTPAAFGQPAQAVVLYMRARQGDTIEILDATALGKNSGADIKLYLSRPVVKPNGDVVIGESLEPLIGNKITRSSPSTGPDTQVGIVAEMTPREAGRFEITDMRLNYRINDGPAETGNGIDVTFTVCGGATTCEAD